MEHAAGLQHSTLRCGLRHARPAVGLGRSRVCVRASTIVELPPTYKTVKPKGDLVLAKVAEAEDKTTGGILLPDSAQQKPTSGDVVAVGDGRVGGITQDFTLQEGDTILYSKFGIGATDISVQGDLHVLIREDDVIGTLPRSGATAADVPELKPLADRVLLKIQDAAEQTLGGIMLPEAAREKPIAGTVVRVGPGKREKDGTRKAPTVKEGDSVLYFKWAGDKMETPTGEQYVVLHNSDILCRV